MISINDYDTGIKIEDSSVKRLKAMSGILIDKLNSIPIFFVKEETMDKHCNSTCLRRECFAEIMHGYEIESMEDRNHTSDEKIGTLMDRIGGCMGKCIATGCYISQGDEICVEPHILICQERIRNRTKEQFENLLLETILHELSHAYFSNGHGSEDLTTHIIEETLCEAYAFSKFEDSGDLYEIMSDKRRPPEYTAFKFWIEILRHVPFSLLMIEWKAKNYFSFRNIMGSGFYRWRFVDNDLEMERVALTILKFS